MGAGIHGGRQRIRTAQDDLAHEALDGPPVLAQAQGEVIEEFRVGGPIPVESEVIRRGDDSPAHEVHPDAVGGDARGQGVLGADEPLGELQPAAGACGQLHGIAAVQHRDQSARDAAGLLADLAPHEERAVVGDALADSHRAGGIGGGQRRQGALGVHAALAVGVGASSGPTRCGVCEGPWPGSPCRQQVLAFRAQPEAQEARGLPVAPVVRRAVQRLRAPEDPGHRVVIALGNRVELVVVASGTGDRNAEDRPCGDVDLLVHDVHDELLATAFVEPLGTQR